MDKERDSVMSTEQKRITLVALVCLLQTAYVAPADVITKWGAGTEVETQGRTIRFIPQIRTKSYATHTPNGDFAPPNEGHTRAFDISIGGGRFVRGQAFLRLRDNVLDVAYRLVSPVDAAWDEFGFSMSLSQKGLVGGRMELDGQAVKLAPEPPNPHLFYGCATRIVCYDAVGREVFAIRFRQPQQLLLQDNLRWGFDEYVIRVRLTDNGYMRRNVDYTTAFTLTTPVSMGVLRHDPGETITPGPNWLAVRGGSFIEPGSALDFSRLLGSQGPAGRHGFLRKVGDGLEFSGLPGVRQRFYGVNVCMEANFPEPADAERLAENLARIGYNAIRYHHHDNMLDKDPAAFAKFDALFAACRRRGIYATTDLYVSRDVKWREIGYERDGNVPRQVMKELIPVCPAAYSNFLAFADRFMGHRNPHTGLTYAEDPALPLIALINEGNYGNKGYDLIESDPWWKKARAEWNAKHPGGTRNAFLADVEAAFFSRAKRHFVEKFGSRALFSDFSSWTFLEEYRAARATYDYADDHFYVDHPEFLGEKPWRQPSRCGNTNPLKGGSPYLDRIEERRPAGAVTTVSEFNFCGPGRYRGVAGVVTAAYAAAKGWSGLWRFAWSHSLKGVVAPETCRVDYLDICGDLLALASERASLCLYLRRDLDETESPDEAIRFDRANGTLRIVTPRTCAVFAERGALNAGALTVDVGDVPATVWASSLDGRPLVTSSRILITHLTDVQNTGVRYADSERKVLLGWGRLPLLMRQGQADVSLQTSRGNWKVFALSPEGRRLAEIPVRPTDNGLAFTAETVVRDGAANFVYEALHTPSAE